MNIVFQPLKCCSNKYHQATPVTPDHRTFKVLFSQTINIVQFGLEMEINLEEQYLDALTQKMNRKLQS